MKESDVWYTAMTQYNQTVYGGVSGFVGSARYSGRRPRVIPPNGREVHIPVKIPKAPGEVPYIGLLERVPVQNGPGNLLVANTLITVSNQYVKLKVVNPTDKPATIRRNTRLADLYVIDSIEEGPNVSEDASHVTESKEATQVSQIVENSDDKETGHVSKVDFNKEQLSSTHVDMVNKLLETNADVFSKDSEDYGHTETLKHRIPLIDETPFKIPHRRVKPAEYKELVETLKGMEAQGVIKQSKSPYSSPIVTVRKKDGTLRICIDYRTLNSKTVKDAFPMPRIDEALDALGGAQYFSTLDLTSGYWQIEVDEADQQKTAFATPMGLYECVRMPMGLVNAPATFQRLMLTIFGDMNIEQLLIYLDDLIVFSKTVEEHVDRLEQVFDRLRQNGLKLKPQKCHLFKEEVNYLGHIVSRDGIATDPEKIQQVKEWKTPENKAELLRFLGFTGYYRRFVKDYAKIAAPLHKLAGELKTDKKQKSKQTLKFTWSEECNAAFLLLKDKLVSAPLLGYPDFTLPFIVQTDASTKGLGAVLSQVQDGKEQVIAYASRKLTNTEERYAAHKLEFLALKWAVTEKFKDYLFNTEFTVYTDNNPLCYVMQTARLDACRQRWVAELSSYNFTIVYRPGKSNTNADALSRMYQDEVKRTLDSTLQPDHHKDNTHCSHIIKGRETLPGMKPGEMQMHQQEDTTIAQVAKYVENKKRPTVKERTTLSREVKLMLKQWPKLTMIDGILVRQVTDPKKGDIDQIVLPVALQKEAIDSLHTTSHPGYERTLELVRERFYWPKMSTDVKTYCETCKRCGLRKPLVTERAPLKSITTSRPLELVCLDYLKLEKSKGGFENVLVVTDHFTRLAQAYPTRNQTGKTIAATFWKRFMCVYGIPERIHTDQGANFEGDLIKELCKITGMTKSRTTAYHPQGNGLTERFNSTLMNMLGTLDPSKKHDWKDHIETMTHAYNATVHDSTGYTPFYLMFGRHPKLPLDLAFGVMNVDEPTDDEDYCEYVESLRERLQHSYETAQAISKKSKAKQRKVYDRKVKGREFCVGDRVLKAVKGLKGRHKLADRWTGPYIVKEKKKNQPVYVIQSEVDNKCHTVHRNLLRQCMFLITEADDDEINTNPEEDNSSSPEEASESDCSHEKDDTDDAETTDETDGGDGDDEETEKESETERKSDDSTDTQDAENADNVSETIETVDKETQKDIDTGNTKDIDKENKKVVQEEADKAVSDKDKVVDSNKGPSGQTTVTKRSTRKRKTPQYLSNYVCHIYVRDSPEYKCKLHKGHKLFDKFKQKML